MSTAHNWSSPEDYLRHNLALVRSGRKTRAPGIKRCRDCDEPFIDRNTGLSYCPDCRTNHDRHCQGCRARMRNTTEGHRYCVCCQNQLPLNLLTTVETESSR